MEVFVICIACWFSGYLIAKLPEFTTNESYDDWER